MPELASTFRRWWNSRWEFAGRSALLVALVAPLPSQDLAVGKAYAQDRAAFVQAFAGEWRSLSGNFTENGQRCFIELSAGDGSTLPIQNRDCGKELAGLASWEIDDGQIVLFDGDAREVARLGGNQRQIHGATGNGNAVIFDRASGPFAFGERGCVFVGYTDRCALPEELGTPRVDGDGADIEVLTNSNIRSSASAAGQVVGVVPPNTCMPVDRCTAGPDGAWCRARVDGQTGWIKKQDVRLGQYPTVMFKNGC